MSILKSYGLVMAIAITSSLPPQASGQVASSPATAKIDDAIRRVQQNDLGIGPVDALSFVALIADAQALRALPILEQYYERTSDSEIKAGVASALVRMGDKKDEYWNYLLALATQAVDTDAPDAFDAAGGISSELKIWAAAHGLSVEAAYKSVTLDLSLRLTPLAKTGDPRGVLLLRKGLSSPNFMISSLSAAGLAQAQDKDSIPLIIDACRRAPTYLASFFANSLLFFRDPRAETTFTFYNPGVNIEEARKFHNYRPFGRLAETK